MQGSFSNDKSVGAWCHYRWTPSLVTKTQAQIAPGQGQTMVQIDNEYTGSDFSASVKAISPSILEGDLTGIFIGSYLQSVTPTVALGVEGVYQRAGVNSRPETAMSYCGRYKGKDWLASAQYLAQGSVNVSYWKRLTERVEAGVDCSLQFAPGLGVNGGLFGNVQREGTTTVGVKYDFRASTYRAQVDSAGKIGVVLEKRVAAPVMLTFAGEIDQVKVCATQLTGPNVLVDFQHAHEIVSILSKRTNSGSPSHLRGPLTLCKRPPRERTRRTSCLRRSKPVIGIATASFCRPYPPYSRRLCMMVHVWTRIMSGGPSAESSSVPLHSCRR